MSARSSASFSDGANYPSVLRGSVNAGGGPCEVLGAVDSEIVSLREVLARRPLVFFDRASLPGAVRIVPPSGQTGPASGEFPHLKVAELDPGTEVMGLQRKVSRALPRTFEAVDGNAV